MEQTKRERVIAMRVTDDEYFTIRDAAREDSRPMADFVRVRVLSTITEVAHRS